MTAKYVVICGHGRRRPTQFPCSAAGRRGAAVHRPRHPHALDRAPTCACSGSATGLPYIGSFREEAERCLALMPAPQARGPRQSGAAPCSRRTTGPVYRSWRSTVRCWYTRSRTRPIRSGFCAKTGAHWRRWPLARGGALTGRGCGRAWIRRRSAMAALIPRPHASVARDLVHAGGLGRSPLCAAGGTRLVFALGRSPGNAPGPPSRPVAGGAHIVEGDQTGLSPGPLPTWARTGPAWRLFLERVLAPTPGAAAWRFWGWFRSGKSRGSGHGSAVTAAASAPVNRRGCRSGGAPARRPAPI